MNACESGRSPDERAWGGQRQWARRWGRMVPFIGLATIASGPAMAQPIDGGIYNTHRMLKHLGNECMGVQNCRTIQSPQTQIAVGQSVSIVTQCPSAQPNVIGWDTEQSEHLGASLARVQSTSGQPVGAVTVIVTNNAGAPGSITVFLGCTDQIPQTTAARQYRGGNPSNLDPITRLKLR
jgi:hypothetical protein